MLTRQYVGRQPYQRLQRAATAIAPVQIRIEWSFSPSNYGRNFAGDILATRATRHWDVERAIGADRSPAFGLGLVNKFKSFEQPGSRGLEKMGHVRGLYRSNWDARTLLWIGTPARVIVASGTNLRLNFQIKLGAYEDVVERSVGQNLLSQISVIATLNYHPGGGIGELPAPGWNDEKISNLFLAH